MRAKVSNFDGISSVCAAPLALWHLSCSSPFVSAVEKEAYASPQAQEKKDETTLQVSWGTSCHLWSQPHELLVKPEYYQPVTDLKIFNALCKFQPGHFDVITMIWASFLAVSNHKNLVGSEISVTGHDSGIKGENETSYRFSSESHLNNKHAIP